ncbi:FAD-binding molybdopterin dehydrogenase [Bradyrhizobium sp. SSBR45G]|uniref:FAD binding domain-containing protein n=1 Tax=unclassified Bradyrhizobium TaxID=2631580 RepID=UPI002342A532|nr:MULTISPECIES: FAD binding domain-containing protein [unclassified Bradyrhizobium]GLH81446.1 FAD-binding molybdopterin dehydrogenase [Bradyrhizobium sp. SSBR45G]GLH88853.1 FAD-binding molybdopterin dehydrogenase [Bradyrhizobium sp. SSBR45R]
MDLNTITEVVRPRTRADLPSWKAGDAWLAGGTWLFSEPQARLSRLIDLSDLAWPPLAINDQGLSIAATCSVAELDALPCPADWVAAPLIDQCCRAFLASFKIWKTATVGGNLCMSLPAGPMISLLAALEGLCTIWKTDGSEQRIAVADFVTGNNSNVLAPGDLLRQIDVPLSALRRRTAFRQIALTPVGRSGALLIGTAGRDGDLLLTVTGSTVKPLQLRFATMPDAATLRSAIQSTIPDALYHDDVHGKPVWRKAMTLRLAEEIRAELAGGIRP